MSNVFVVVQGRRKGPEPNSSLLDRFWWESGASNNFRETATSDPSALDVDDEVDHWILLGEGLVVMSPYSVRVSDLAVVESSGFLLYIMAESFT